jgi:hypothetical protein
LRPNTEGKRLLDDTLFQAKLASDEGKEEAAAKLALSMSSDEVPHLMISYCWAQQDLVKRIRADLDVRGYKVWFDLEQMAGSTVVAMAEAIDGAYAVVYGISLAYKESQNCRMEALYAHQQQLPMVPMMLQENYKAKGWLGMLLGTSLWHGARFRAGFCTRESHWFPRLPA